MSRFFVYLGRLAVMIFGFAVAAVAASAFVYLIAFGAMGVLGEEPGDVITAYRPFQTLTVMIVSVLATALLVGYFAFFPAMVFLIIGEILRRRDWLFYALGGAASSLPMLALLFAPGLITEGGGDTSGVLLAVPVGAGLVGGIAYWAVAGRSAGNWRERPAASSRGVISPER